MKNDQQLPIVYLVSPNSLKNWFQYFVNPDRQVIFLGENQELNCADILSDLQLKKVDKYSRIIIYSSHFTLQRDYLIGELLEWNGYNVFRQSKDCSLLGIDKIQMKYFLNENNFQTIQWFSQTDVPQEQANLRGLYVLKERYSTEGSGNTLLELQPTDLENEYYVECFEEGTEYSVIVFLHEEQWITFPPIWKGKTQTDLTPPYIRLRMCPYIEDPEILQRMRELSVELARQAKCEGFMEVEFIVNDLQEIKVLEINPRISGTMRIAALATQTDIFSIGIETDLCGHLEAKKHVIEVPYQGVPIIDPKEQIFSTSRLTVAGSDYRDVQDKLYKLKDRGIELNQQFLDQFEFHCAKKEGVRLGI
jgi:D-alanine-D-alanine ligase-like ATP-grasp enzyme